MQLHWSYARYLDYLESPRWRRFRRLALRRAHNRCEHCGGRSEDGSLDVHHLTYERLGHERLTDVEVLCRWCHKEADVERQWDSRVRGWAKKVHGPYWWRMYSFEDMEMRFAKWLERKGLH